MVRGTLSHQRWYYTATHDGARIHLQNGCLLNLSIPTDNLSAGIVAAFDNKLPPGGLFRFDYFKSLAMMS